MPTMDIFRKNKQNEIYDENVTPPFVENTDAEIDALKDEIESTAGSGSIPEDTVAPTGAPGTAESDALDTTEATAAADDEKVIMKLITNRSVDQLDASIAKMEEEMKRYRASRRALIQKQKAKEKAKAKKEARAERDHHMITTGAHLESLQGENGYDQNKVGLSVEDIDEIMRLRNIGYLVEFAMGHDDDNKPTYRLTDLDGFGRYCIDYAYKIKNFCEQR